MAFIVFEGLDACGKSTLMAKVEQALSQKNQSPLILRDPGATDLGERVREIILATDIEAPVPRAEILLYQAARVQMVEKNIVPALQNNQWVLCDRFYSSTVSFQSFARGLDLEDVNRLNHFVAHDCPPDLFIFIDVPIEESQKRKISRAKESGVAQDRMEKEAESFQEKVRDGYVYQAKKNPESWLTLDGTLPPEVLLDQTLKEFERRQWLG